ncbi:MAG: GtrA family protein [Chloroflexota bacterium]|nr:GtrA family protein [Chloroflexota bacterium]
MSLARLRTLLEENRLEVQRFLKFSVVGAIGAVVDFSVLNFGIQVLGLYKGIANAISFSMAVMSNFTWNRLWTYPESRQKSIVPQLSQFFAVNVVGLVINEVIFLSLDHFVFAPWGTWGYNLSKAIAIGVVWFWNFYVNRIWTYRDI